MMILKNLVYKIFLFKEKFIDVFMYSLEKILDLYVGTIRFFKDFRILRGIINCEITCYDLYLFKYILIRFFIILTIYDIYINNNDLVKPSWLDIYICQTYWLLFIVIYSDCLYNIEKLREYWRFHSTYAYNYLSKYSIYAAKIFYVAKIILKILLVIILFYFTLRYSYWQIFGLVPKYKIDIFFGPWF